ncbi:MAG: GntR family transcriptional regulator [Chitinophaga sp.]|jgi:pectinesterase|nr:GntR family transcriptional regulator [Chitinophaga sp.]
MKKHLVLSIALAVCAAFIKPDKKITIWMIGDSTMANKQEKAFPETGWGMAFGQFFNKDVTIDNRAQNGRSTLSFINEKRWDEVYNNLKEGDYVFIEFGHNDEKIDKPGVGVSIDEYKKNLSRFVNEARSKKAIPVLLTPITRRSFKNGVFTETHGLYPDAVRTVADSLHVPLIDMHKKSIALITSMGDEPSKALYNYLEAGHKNYPEGKKDDTHFSPLGAKKIAALAVEGIKELKLDLVKYLIN